MLSLSGYASSTNALAAQSLVTPYLCHKTAHHAGTLTSLELSGHSAVQQWTLLELEETLKRYW